MFLSWIAKEVKEVVAETNASNSKSDNDYLVFEVACDDKLTMTMADIDGR